MIPTNYQETPVNRLFILLLLLCSQLFAETVAQIESMYATSSASDTPLSYLFDNSAQTTWKSIAGTGPEEGIMVYFKTPVLINGLTLQNFTYDKESVSGYETYINGKKKEITYNTTKVRSLFIKFKRKDRYGLRIFDKGYLFQISNAKATSPITIADIEFLNNNKPLIISLPQEVAATVTASSTLTPKSAYSVHNLFDARKEFTWCEGVDGDGVSEKLTFTFQEKQKITGLRLSNGYQRSRKHFQANGRIMQAIVTTGSLKDTVTLKDTYGIQEVSLKRSVESSSLTIEILKVYPGKKYKDLCLSELTFLSGNTLLRVKNDTYTAQKRAGNIKKYNGTLLSKLLDRVLCKFHDADGEDDIYENTKLILRSDNTFVYYSELGDVSSGETKNIVADGNWSFVSQKGDVQTIKLFGQWLNVSEIESVYSGSTQSSYQRIFQDQITIQKRIYTGNSSEAGLQLLTSSNRGKISKDVITLTGGKFLKSLFANAE